MTEQADRPGELVLCTSEGLAHVQAVGADEAGFAEIERLSNRESRVQ